MIVFRIAQKQYIHSLDGMGSFRYGGRWTSKGTSAIYTAENRSLAYLEYLVHQFDRKTWPSNLAISKLTVKDDLVFDVSPDKLASNWQNLAYVSRTQTVGNQFFQQGKLAVRVPSVIVPDEYNIILNPKHPEFIASVDLESVEDLKFDKRFYSN